jgi:histone-lysine N-methyltransferase SETD3
MSLHDRLKFNKGLKQTISDKNRNFFIFKKWLEKGGANYPNLFFKKYSDSERGMHAKKKIIPNTEVMYIPSNLLITNDNTSRYSTDMGSSINSLNNTNLLKIALYILDTIDDRHNFYQPYYQILPKDISHLPIFWDKSVLNLLESSDFLNDIMARKKMLTNEYSSLCNLSENFRREITLYDWLWARSIVGSRNFSINVDGSNKSAMVPLADMLNHYRPAETKWGYDNNKRGFTMTTLKGINHRAQIMDSYGRKSNRKYLLHYGFVMDDNIESDGTCDDDIIIEIPDSNSSRKLYVNKDNFIDKLMPTLRLANRTKQEFNNTGDSNSMISPRNEVASLLSMANIARNMLLQFPKTYSQNVSELKKLKGFSKERNAINFVKKQKELLLFIKKLADDMIPIVGFEDISNEQINNKYKQYVNN